MFGVFDFNKEYSDLGKKIVAARSALRTTTYGLGGAIRVEEDPDVAGNIRFVLSGTGETFKTMDQAINRASSIYVSQVVSATEPKMGNKLSGIGAVMKNIRESVTTLTAEQKRWLAEAGIDVANLPTLEIDVMTFSGGKGEASKIANNILKMRERGELHGITMMDDDSARVLTMRVAKTGQSGKQMLTAEQAHLLLRVTGHGIISQDQILDLMASGENTKLGEKLLKVGKRFRTFVSERELSFAGAEIQKLVGAGKNLTDSMLILDPQYEMMRMFSAQVLDETYDFGGNKGLQAFYQGRDIDSYFGRYIEGLTDSEKRELANAIKKSQSKINISGKKFASDELESFIEKKFKGNERILQAFRESYESIKYAFDGSDLLNERFIRNYRDQMLKEKKRLQSIVDNVKLPRAQKEAAAYELNNISNILRQIGEDGDISFDQIVGRGNLGPYGNIKTAFDTTSDIFAKKDLRKYLGIISKFGLKGEMGLAGTEDALLLAGFGRHRDLVFSDPVSAAFHPEVFADKETLDAIQNRARTVMGEFESSLQQGILPKKLKAMLEQQVKTGVEHLPAEARATARRNREFARAILEMHQAGISPKDSPRMMNMIHKIYATQVFRSEVDREGRNVYKTVLPETYRFALDSEAALSGESAVLGRGFEKLNTRMANGELLSEDILNFRIRGGKMYFAPQAIGQVRGVLGGFDLDDKGIARMFRYTDDNGMTRIAFNLTRQPSGAEEKMMARAYMDEDTIRAIAQGSDYFKEALDELILGRLNPLTPYSHVQTTSTAFIDPTVGPNILSSKEYQTLINLKSIIEGEDISRLYGKNAVTGARGRFGKSGENARIRAELESAIDTVYRQMESMGFTTVRELSEQDKQIIKRQGTAALKMERLIGPDGKEVSPRYTRAGIYNIMSQAGAFDMSDEIRQLVEKAPLDESLRRDLLAAKDFNTMLKSIAVSAKGGDPRAMALFESAFGLKSLSAQAKGGDVLGMYINRSMVIGSTLNQYEAYLNSVDENVRNYLLKNFQIGLLSQEEAIDYAVNATGAIRQIDLTKQKLIHRESTAILAQTYSDFPFYSEEGVLKSVQQLLKTKENIGLDAIGEKGIEDLGRLTGFIRGFGSVDSSLLLGIDEELIRTRLGKTDLKRYLDSIISGMQESLTYNPNIPHANELQTEINQLMEISKSDNAEQIKATILERFALTADHQYASLSRIQALGSRLDQYFDTIRRTSIARFEDDILKSSATTVQSDILAEEFLDRNKKSLDYIFSKTKEDFERMSQRDLANFRARSEKISDDLLRQIDEGSKIQGVSIESLVNSLDRLTRGTGIDIGRFSGIEDVFGEDVYGNLPEKSMSEVEQKIARARTLRSIRYYQSFDKEIADQIITTLSAKTYEEAQDAAAKIARQQTGQGELVDAIMSLLAEDQKTFESMDPEIRREALTQVEIIRSQLADMSAFDDLSEMGQISSAEDAARILGDDSSISDDLINTVIDYENYDPVNKATYKRFSEKIKSGDFKKLFKEPTIRKGTLALGALIAGSIAYTVYKDRTYEDASGPPLLPGGSAYEQYPTRIPEIGSFGGQGYESGSSYNISVNGNPEDIERFNEAARGLVNGNTSTTIFNRIPNLREDLYSMLGSSY